MKLTKRPWGQQRERAGKSGPWWGYPLGLLCLGGLLVGTVLPVYGCLVGDTTPLAIGAFLWVGGLIGGKHLGAMVHGDEPDGMPLFFTLGGAILSGVGYVCSQNPGSPACLIGYFLGVLGLLLTLEEAA